MAEKRGLDISLNFVIVAALALIALIVIALFFTGALDFLFQKEGDIVGSLEATEIAFWKTTCNLHCTTKDQVAWNNPNFPLDFEDSGVVTCSDLMHYLNLQGENEEEDFDERCLSEQ